ncbi:hypothetical protein [Paucidesulfovibrio gracilis]|uniref:hypothetical protein n=1 Tax=Paucidesulfovibrio gracilis TaxID=47158 RepID=UPI00099AEE22|nr:hypothetical protein [Paucidesulfovibrio gracilis]
MRGVSARWACRFCWAAWFVLAVAGAGLATPADSTQGQNVEIIIRGSLGTGPEVVRPALDPVPALKVTDPASVQQEEAPIPSEEILPGGPLHPVDPAETE